METSISKFIGRPDLVRAVKSLEVKQGTAKESGNTYYYVVLKFANGYEHRLFLQGAEQFAWINAFEMLDIEKQVEANFASNSPSTSSSAAF